MRIARDILILAVIFAAIWGVFAWLTKGTGNIASNLISVANEEKLGDLIYEYQIKNDIKGKVLKSKELGDANTQLLERLKLGLNNSKYQYKIYIIDNSEVNAFTIPGGKIFIYSGLIEKLDSSATLASVVAHEIGHNEKRHLVNRLLTMFGIQLLMGGDQVVIGEVIKQLGALKYARSQEAEADKFALDLLEKCNLNPKHFASAMGEFIDLQDDMDASLEILNTHPASADRRREALEYKVKPNFKEKPLAMNWEAYKKAIKSAQEKSE
jgi:beta-barrel assembly-enhancing protease